MPAKKGVSQKIVKEGIISTSKDYAENIPLIKVSYLGVGISFLSILFVLLGRNNLPPEVPLFYGLAKGEEQLVKTMALAIPSVSSIIIISINTTLSYFLKNNLLQKTLVLAGLAASIFTTITTIKIIFLVGSF